MLTQDAYVLDLLLKEGHVTAQEIIDKSKLERLFITHPENPISHLRDKGVPIRTRLEPNIHNSGRHACWFLTRDYKREVGSGDKNKKQNRC